MILWHSEESPSGSRLDRVEEGRGLLWTCDEVGEASNDGYYTPTPDAFHNVVKGYWL